jgi:integrase
MGRYKKDFTLYSRPLKNGQEVWYYRTYTEDGRRTPGISTGKTSKTLAEKHCNKLMRENKLIPPRQASAAPPLPTLREWAEAERWWHWNECRYLRGRLARSEPGKPAVSRRYADDARRDLKKYILPRFGEKRLDQITVKDCDDWVLDLRDRGLSHKTVNNILSYHRIMMHEAWRQKLIPESPWERVEGLKISRKGKGILMMAEYLKLMDPSKIDAHWSGNMVYYSGSLLASVTGLRSGEVLALKRADLFPDHIRVVKSWGGKKYGLGSTKTKRMDDIPIPSVVFQAIDSWCRWQGFIFSFQRGAKPCSGNRMQDALSAALVAIGITNDERTHRRLSFHSWRAFANTYMLGRGISPAKVRELTRHATEEMTQLYTDFHPEHFTDVAKAQEELVADLATKKQEAES